MITLTFKLSFPNRHSTLKDPKILLTYPPKKSPKNLLNTQVTHIIVMGIDYCHTNTFERSFATYENHLYQDPKAY